MSRLYRRARVAVLVALVALGFLPFVLVEPVGLAVALGAVGAGLATIGAWTLWNDRRTGFSAAAGMLLMLSTASLAVFSGSGLAVVWATFGVGLAALLAGVHTCRAAGILMVPRKVDEGSEAPLYRAALRGYSRILVFVGLVMVSSLVILMLSLNAAIGSMPSWAMASLALVAMVSLAVLARARYREG